MNPGGFLGGDNNILQGFLKADRPNSREISLSCHPSGQIVSPRWWLRAGLLIYECSSLGRLGGWLFSLLLLTHHLQNGFKSMHCMVTNFRN